MKKEMKKENPVISTRQGTNFLDLVNSELIIRNIFLKQGCTEKKHTTHESNPCHSHTSSSSKPQHQLVLTMGAVLSSDYVADLISVYHSAFALFYHGVKLVIQCISGEKITWKLEGELMFTTDTVPGKPRPGISLGGGQPIAGLAIAETV